MKPPICELCGHRFDPVDGDLVTFVGDERSQAWRRRATEKGITGHPPDQGWFCAEHAESARQLSGSFTFAVGLRELRRRIGDEPVGSGVPRPAARTTGSGAEFRRHVERRRDLPITPQGISAIARLFDTAFAEMVDVLVGLDASLDAPPPVALASEVEVLDAPEPREPEPAAEETTETRTVVAAGWTLQREHRHLDWYHGGRGRASESISISPVDRDATFDRRMLVMASMPVGDRVTEVSVTGEVPEFLQSVVEDLIEALTSSAGTSV